MKTLLRYSTRYIIISWYLSHQPYGLLPSESLGFLSVHALEIMTSLMSIHTPSTPAASGRRLSSLTSSDMTCMALSINFTLYSKSCIQTFLANLECRFFTLHSVTTSQILFDPRTFTS